jgi:hypothetical protein
LRYERIDLPPKKWTQRRVGGKGGTNDIEGENMKNQPIKFIKSAIAYIKSLGWGKEDVKKILMLVIMLLIACFIFNRFLKIKIRGHLYTDTSVSGSVDTDTTVSGFVDVSR